MIRSIITKRSRVLVLLLSIVITTNAQVSVNTTGSTANTSAMLDVSSTDKGILIPRMTTNERTAISNPADALLVYDTWTDSFWYYNGTDAEWQKVGGATRINELSDGSTDASNLFLGSGSGSNNGGIFNTALGSWTLHDNTSGEYNVAMGNQTMNSNTTGSYNTAIGRFTLHYNISGDKNTAVGASSNLRNTTGDFNVGVGYRANLNNQEGINNTIIGTEAGMGVTDHNKSGNIFLGYQAGYNEIGDNKLYIENSNSSTPLIGGDFTSDYVDINGDLNLSGSIKIEGGTPGANKVLTSDVDGNATWEVASSGASELNDLSDAIYDGSSLFMGNGSGLSDNGSANKNTGIGINALRSNIDGYNNIATGYETLKNNTHGYNNSALGMWALHQNITGTNNVAVGSNSLYYNDSSSYSTAVGSNALHNNKGYYNTAVGYSSLKLNTDGSANVAVGNSALYNHANGHSNVAVGSKALESNILGDDNTVIGSYAGRYATGSGNIFIGNRAGYNDTSSNKLYIENSNSSTPLIGGDFANDSLFFNGVVRITGGNPGANKILTSDVDGNATWEIGSYVTELNDLTDAIYDGGNLYLGTNAGINSNANLLNVGVGKFALEDNIGGFMNTATGNKSLQTNTSGQNNAAFGSSSLEDNSTGNYNTAMGSTVLQNNTSSNNTAVGYAAMITNTSGYKNVAIGVNTLKFNVNGFYNVAVGYDALKSVQSGTYNSAFGANSLLNTTGDRNTASGYSSLSSNTTGDFNTAFGYRSGYDNTSGTYNTFLGYNARVNNTTAKTNSTAVGNDAVITASNQVRIGNASVTDIGGFADWSNISDSRFKYNVSEDVSGLDFIMNLRPVTYNLDIQKINNFLGVETEGVDNESVTKKSNIRQSGFIAQEVEEAAKSLGFEFSGIDTPDDENDHYGLRYAQFVVPLVKAVQEQQVMIKELQKENNELKKLQLEIEEIKRSLKMLQK